MARLEEYDTEVEPSDFDRLPPFRDTLSHIEEIIVADISRDNPATGRCLNITWKVDEGPLYGRLFWQRINLWFDGAEKTPGKVRSIAAQKWAAVREATVGLNTMIVDTDQFPLLYHRQCLVTYGPQNKNPDHDEVKSVKAAGNAPVQQNRAPAARQSPGRTAPPQGRQAPAAQSRSGGGGGGNALPFGARRQPATAAAGAGGGFLRDLDDDIPF